MNSSQKKNTKENIDPSRKYSMLLKNFMVNRWERERKKLIADYIIGEENTKHFRWDYEFFFVWYEKMLVKYDGMKRMFSNLPKFLYSH